MRHALEGLRVIAIEQFGAGPWATLQLADLGAEVIKLEDPSVGGDVGRYVPPFNDGTSSLFFETFNRNKRSVTLDLRHSDGRRVFEDLVRVSDAVFSNLRGDQPKKLGLRYDDLQGINPRVVCVSLSGFGMTGPRAAEGAYDITIQALAGWMAMTGSDDAPPTKSGLSLVDFASGYLATIGILAGVWEARRSGVGRDVDLSLFDAGLALLTYMGTWSASRGWAGNRMADSAHQTIVPFQAFRASDGWLVVACAKEDMWRRFCLAIERPALAEDDRFGDFAARDENRGALLGIIDAELATRTVSEWLHAFARHRVPSASVNDPAGALADAQAAARGSVVGYQHPVLGDVKLVASPLALGANQSDIQRAPMLGEDTDDVLAEMCGYSESQITTLYETGALGSQRTVPGAGTKRHG